MEERRQAIISKAESPEEIGEFWDSHDFTEFDIDADDFDFEISCAVPIESELFSSIEEQAKQRGVRAETLVNLWLQEKLVEQSQVRV